MEKDKQKPSEIPETLWEKALRAMGVAFLACLWLIIFFMIFLAIFMKGVIKGWF